MWGKMTEVFIPRWHPTPLNKLTRNWRQTSRLKKADREMVGAYMRGYRKDLGKRRVGLTIVLSKGKRACDPDAYWKSTLDALVYVGLLKDDSRHWVELEKVEFTRSDDWGTWIIIEDV